MVLAEVVQNALQHAFDGVPAPATPAGGFQVTITVDRSAKELDIVVSDNGVGLPAGFAVEQAAGLGLQIVRTLVEAELLGRSRWETGRVIRGRSCDVSPVPLRGRS